MLAIFDDCSEFCSTFDTLHFEKSSNYIEIVCQKMKKNLPIITITKMAAFGTKNVLSAIIN